MDNNIYFDKFIYIEHWICFSYTINYNAKCSVVYHPPSGSRKKNKAVQKHADARHDLASICHFLYSQRSNICAHYGIDLVSFVVDAVNIERNSITM